MKEMVKKSIFFFVFIVFVVSGIYFVSATEGVDCFRYTGNYSACVLLNSTCFWGNNSGVLPSDPMCSFRNSNYNSTVLTMYLPWVGTNLPYNNITGGLIINSGCCIMKMGGGGGSGGGQGCWSFDGNQTGCSTANQSGISGCVWKANNQNQNPMCNNNIGCCEKQGCWGYKGNQTACVNDSAGYCSYDTRCPSGDCCITKSCSEMDTEAKCGALSSSYDMPCQWIGGQCQMLGGGFSSYNNNSQSCMSSGGIFNPSTGNCTTTSSGGGGGFMFAQEAKCWFGDNKPSVCGNVSGCVYCSNSVTQLTNISSACYNAPIGSCKGHEQRYTNYNGTTINITDINVSSMTCSDIRLDKICRCGPLPSCKWTNSSTNTGNYCVMGMKTSEEMQSCQPPAMFCEATNSKNNQTLCNLLASDYMMPCKWDSTLNCTFNSMAIFGGGGGSAGSGGMDYNIISNEISCIAAGGSWKTSFYEDNDGTFKEDAWCEKGAMFSFSTGQSFANKGSCDSDCWACNFNSTGGAWPNVANASAACQNSKKGICKFKADSNAPNRLGWCDYPQELSFGSNADCSSDCKACEFMGNSSQVQQACSSSTKGCSWVNDTNAPNGKGGYCMSSSMKSCISDCFACYEQSKCSNSTNHPSLNCSWDVNFKLCKPQGFTGEICFNAIDDDNDGKSDCADSDCTYDQFCGGASMGGGSGNVDCKRIFVSASCINNKTASGINCTWVQPNFGPAYCDFPGSDCWMYETNITGCRKDVRGCIYRNLTAGYPMGADGPKLDFKSFPGFCDMNKTKANVCFNSSNMNNFTNCNATNECVWISESYNDNGGGRCEFRPFAVCGNNTNAASCNALSSWCAWRNNSFSASGGFCEPSCAGKIQGACTGFCSWKSSSCEPEMFGGMESGGSGAGGVGGGYGCHMNDGNQTACLNQNMSCAWMSFSQNSSMGICQPKGEQQMMQGMDMNPPKILGNDANDTSQKEIDIREFGVKESPGSLGFGIVVTNITDAAVCRGYYIGSMGGNMCMGMACQPRLANGTTTTKYYWYLDTNKNISDGCNATKSDGTNITGFEFLIKYVVSLDNLTVSETKSFYKCASGSWINTNVPLTSNRQMTCGITIPGFGNDAGKLGGAIILVDKEQLKSFSEYNQTAPMRVFVSSANDSTNELNPLDSISSSGGYYTSGSADFKFVDCSNPSTKDSKCKNFQQYGFNIFEDCKNNKDDDGDGLSDCNDPKCKFTPVCSGSAFNFVVDANDQQSPTVTFSQVDVLRDSAFIKFDTDEPANGSVIFYHNDSNCNNPNITISDLGDPLVTFDNYKPFHMVNLDLNNLGYALDNGTIYYYKTSVCDPSNNCATSACQNLTTSNEAYKNFIFKMNLPSGYSVNITGNGINYNGNFTTAIGSTVYPVGVKTNASVSRNINITINCGTQSLTFVGADILKPKSIDMSNAFVCNVTNQTLGMNSTSKSWNQLVGDIGMGGQSDYIKLTYPIAYSSGNTIKWCDDGLSNCTTVNDYASCGSGGSGKTDCKIPTSLGFSAYQITVASTPTTTTTTTTGSSGSGAAGGTTGSTAMTYVVSNNDFIIGYTKQILKGDRFKLNVSGSNHYVVLDKVTSSTASINVTSTLQQATIKSGEEEKFDVTGDGYYDISVRINSVTVSGNSSKASLTVKSINEKMSQNLVTGNAISNTSTATGASADSENVSDAGAKGGSSKFILLILIGIGIGVVILIIVILIIVFKKNKKTDKYVVFKKG